MQYIFYSRNTTNYLSRMFTFLNLRHLFHTLPKEMEIFNHAE